MKSLYSKRLHPSWLLHERKRNIVKSRNQCQCSANHEVARRALADDWKTMAQNFYPRFAQFLSFCTASVWRHFCTSLQGWLLVFMLSSCTISCLTASPVCRASQWPSQRWQHGGRRGSDQGEGEWWHFFVGWCSQRTFNVLHVLQTLQLAYNMHITNYLTTPTHVHLATPIHQTITYLKEVGILCDHLLCSPSRTQGARDYRSTVVSGPPVPSSVRTQHLCGWLRV